MRGCVEIHHPISLVYTVAYDAQEEKGVSLRGSTGLVIISADPVKHRLVPPIVTVLVKANRLGGL